MARTISTDFDEKRDAILKAATTVFAENGFDRASMNMVAKACNISKAGLYHYFPSKNSVLFGLLKRHLIGLKNHTCGLKKDGHTNEEYLRYIIEEILLFYRGNDDIHELQIHALGQLEPADQKILKDIMRELVDFVAEAIAAIDLEKFKERNKLRMATMSLFGMLNWYFTWNSGRGEKGRKEYAQYVAKLFLEGAYS